MRLAISLLIAALLHGVALAVTAAVITLPPRLSRPVATTSEIEIIPARPTEMGDSNDTTPAVQAASPNQAKHQAPRPTPMPHPNSSVRPVREAERERASEPVRALTSDAPALDAVIAAGVVAATLPTAAAVTAASTAPPATPPHAAASATRVAPVPALRAVSSAKPRYRSNPRPDYPIPSRRRHEEGLVWLKVKVAADGHPVAVSLSRSSGYPLLDRAALDAVAQWTFEPARAAGIAISSLVEIPIRFSLSDEP